MPQTSTGLDQSQLDKFKQAAKELETDYDEVRLDERVKKLVKQRLVEEKGD